MNSALSWKCKGTHTVSYDDNFVAVGEYRLSKMSPRLPPWWFGILVESTFLLSGNDDTVHTVRFHSFISRSLCTSNFLLRMFTMSLDNDNNCMVGVYTMLQAVQYFNIKHYRLHASVDSFQEYQSRIRIFLNIVSAIFRLLTIDYSTSYYFRQYSFIF